MNDVLQQLSDLKDSLKPPKTSLEVLGKESAVRLAMHRIRQEGWPVDEVAEYMGFSGFDRWLLPCRLEDSIAVIYPHLIPRYAPSNPLAATELKYCSKASVEWICSKGHTTGSPISMALTNYCYECWLVENPEHARKLEQKEREKERIAIRNERMDNTPPSFRYKDHPWEWDFDEDGQRVWTYDIFYEVAVRCWYCGNVPTTGDRAWRRQKRGRPYYSPEANKMFCSTDCRTKHALKFEVFSKEETIVNKSQLVLNLFPNLYSEIPWALRCRPARNSQTLWPILVKPPIPHEIAESLMRRIFLVECIDEGDRTYHICSTKHLAEKKAIEFWAEEVKGVARNVYLDEEEAGSFGDYSKDGGKGCIWMASSGWKNEHYYSVYIYETTVDGNDVG